MHPLHSRRQARVAMLAIGPATLRNQGAPDMVATAQRYLAQLDLTQFSAETIDSQATFQKVLEVQTRKLAKAFPDGGHGNWGAARKALNIFLRDAVESRSLCDVYHLAHIEPWLEVPLDSHVAEKLCSGWPGIKHLTSAVSDEYQALASIMAEMLDCSRVDLDLYMWRTEQVNDLLGNPDE